MKKIVYIPSFSRIRLYKIAKAVKLTHKFELVLICPQSFYDEELFEGIFDKVIYYTQNNTLKASKYYQYITQKLMIVEGLGKMINLVRQENPDLVHAFCEPYSPIVKLLKETNFPVVMSDGNDFSGISSGIENLNKKTRQEEKYCFENVKGIIHKGPKLEIDYYVKQGYKINCPEITWFDHCDLDLVVKNSTKLSDKTGEIHIVYTGTISRDNSRSYCYYIPLAKTLAKQKIHLHIYPTPYKPYQEYLALDKSEKYFHFHQSLSYKQIITAIAKYDFGLWYHEIDRGERAILEKEQTAIGNKIFTYIEAGLPIIIAQHLLYGAAITTQNKIGIIVTKNNFENFKKYSNNLNFKKEIETFQNNLSLQHQKHQLVNFYNSIIKNNQ